MQKYVKYVICKSTYIQLAETDEGSMTVEANK